MKKIIRLLNPKNLAKEVDVYGYHFSWKGHAMWILGAVVGVGLVGILFQLQVGGFVVIAAAVGMILPALLLDMYKRMYEQKRFGDAAAYMEQMLYSFQKTGKVVSALKETREIFEEGQMRRCLDEAIVHMELGKPATRQGVLREGLEIIGKQYHCMKLQMVQNLLVGTEEYGGSADGAIALMLEDIESWKKRGYRLQAEKKKCHIDNMISIVVAIVLCAIALYVLEEMQELFTSGSSIAVFTIPIIQMSSVLFILVLLAVLLKSNQSLTENWLEEAELHSKEYIIHSYDLVTNYDAGCAGRKSMWGALLLIPAGVLMMKGKYGIALLCLVFMGLILMQHHIGYRLAHRDVTDEMYLALPQWLIQMILLLQNNNVQVAITKSIEGTPVILHKELELLTERLQKEPGKLQSYTSFCKGFDLPEMTGCMKMLHAFSENGTGNLDVQMTHLLERAEQMQDMADGIRNREVTFRMKMMFSYPVVAATVKLLIDLTVGMGVMMQMLGGIGGA